MVPEILTAILVYLAAAVWMGLVFGGLIGSVTGAVVGVMRTHRASGLLTGSILAALPSVAVAIAVGVGAIGLRILLGREGKGGWDLPTWGDDIQFAAMLAGGAAGGTLLTGSSFQPGRRYKSTLAWMLVGGMAGAVGSVPFGFQGYYVLQSNTGPVIAAGAGFVVGAVIVAAWYAIVRRITAKA